MVVLPPLLASHPDGRAFNAWIAACSTGEEAYSLAMVFHEAVARPRSNSVRMPAPCTWPSATTASASRRSSSARNSALT
ncbi:CheR family methyltransferase [Janthinobacterium sp. LB3P112]|uniref:CheR family methyltransferase n=1 Tax=Janthinobacterium sp. LB3P112 TaxID=3424196 RepID=UPI003F2470AB